MKIEFIGSAGSGKTTVATMLSSALNIRYVSLEEDFNEHHRLTHPVSDRANRVIASLQNPKSIYLGARLALDSRSKSGLSLAMVAALRSKLMEAYDNAIIDEGPRHGVCSDLSNFSQIDVQRWAANLTKLIASVDAVVWLESDADLSLYRVKERARTARVEFAYASYDETGVQEYISRYCLAAEQVLRRDLCLIRINTSQITPDEVTGLILDDLDKLQFTQG